MPTDFDSRAKDWDADPKKVQRAKAVAAVIRERVPLSRAMTAFEYGCGTGLVSFALQPWLGPITLADSSTGMLAVLREKIAAAGIGNMAPVRLDLAADPLPATHFDMIYTLMALHHIPDTAKILSGFSTLINPGGHLCIADLDKEDGSFHSLEPSFDGHHGFSHTDLGQLLLQAGFTNINFSTCFEMNKDGRVYTLFLATSEKKQN